jgi:hypothetical protein
MSVQVFASGQPTIKGGVPLTAIGDAANQAVYWEVVSYDPATGLEGEAVGSLLFDRTVTDGAKHSKNYYYASINPIDTGKIERVKVKIAHA